MGRRALFVLIAARIEMNVITLLVFDIDSAAVFRCNVHVIVNARRMNISIDLRIYSGHTLIGADVRSWYRLPDYRWRRCLHIQSLLVFRSELKRAVGL